MAATNTYSDVYIADLDGGNKVYMDIDPSPMPHIPFRAGTVQVSQTLPGLDATDTLVAGKKLVWDGGADLSGTAIEWNCSYTLAATKTSLEAKWNTLEDVRISLDDGSNVYRATWDRNRDPFPVRTPAGRTSYIFNPRFYIISKY